MDIPSGSDKRSYPKVAIEIVDFSIENRDFPSYVKLPEGSYRKWPLIVD